jgi:LmbE family N-acetylglucosaminyl deacetylase
MFINHPRDRHPDHEACYQIVDRGVREAGLPLEVYQYPIWLLWKGPLRLSGRPRELRGAFRLDVRAVQDRKDRAINVYRSQLPVLPTGFVDQFTQGYEVFFQGRTPHGQS